RDHPGGAARRPGARPPARAAPVPECRGDRGLAVPRLGRACARVRSARRRSRALPRGPGGDRPGSRVRRPGLPRLSAGLLSLVYYERWLVGRARPQSFGPGAMASRELTRTRAGVAGWSAARRLSLLIAVGIGLHNFGEGLAIGGS